MAKLKVFRTSIGFHDAYVAATSRKAALEAWGSEKDLFAKGAAEVVTDAKLTAEPLASPGKVIKLTRGNLREHLNAAGPPAPPRPARSVKTPSPKAKPATRRPPPPPPPPPRPGRDELDAAQAALDHARSEADAEIAAIDRRQAELRNERDMLAANHAKAIGKLERQVNEAKARHDRALDRWRKARTIGWQPPRLGYYDGPVQRSHRP